MLQFRRLLENMDAFTFENHATRARRRSLALRVEEMEKKVVLTATALSVSAASGIYGGTTSLSAHLTEGSNNIPGEVVDFHLGATDLGTATTDSNGVAQLSNVSLAGIHTGLHFGDITASFAGDVSLSHDPSSGAADLTVSKATLTITADNQTKVYSAPVPRLTASYQGFVNGDTAASLATAPTLATAASTYSPVSGGPYAINASGAVDPDYNINYVSGTLQVTPAPVIVQAASPFKTYGDVNPSLTGTIYGLVTGDQVTAHFTTTATAQSSVVSGGYPITFTSFTGADAANYRVSATVPAVLTVNPAMLVVIADNQVMSQYGAMPTLTATYYGFVNGDGPSSLTSPVYLSTSASSNSAPGSYVINGTGGGSTNYTVADRPGILSVRPASSNSSSSAGLAQFVNSLYRSYLGRTPDAAGLALWTSQISSGGSKLTAARAIYQSSEAVAYRSAHPRQAISFNRGYNLAIQAGGKGIAGRGYRTASH